MAKQTAPLTILPKRSLRGVQTRTASDAADSGNDIPSDRGIAWFNQDISNLRARGDVIGAVRTLARIDPTMSGAVHSFVQMAMSKWKVTAYDSPTHQFSQEGSMMAKSIIAQFDTLYDYTGGFSQRRSINAILETGLREVVTTGGLGLELVLSKARLPDFLRPVPLTQLKWRSKGEGRGKYPVQEVTGQEAIPLDIPTFWVAHSHEDAGQVYSRTMMEASLDVTFHFTEFLQDVRRVVKRAGHDRLTFVLDHEKIVNAAPREIKNDSQKMQTYLEDTRTQIERLVSGISPDDAIVTYDTVKPEMLRAGQGVQTDYSDMLKMLAGMQASSVKTPPSILGLRLDGGSQALGNIESLIFLRIASSIQGPVEEVMSRALTLACRLYGFDVYVKFAFDPINLRPESELEAFNTMRETNILRKLAYGFITDEEAGHALGTGPRAPGAPPLSGTMFMDAKGTTVGTAPGDTPAGKALQPDSDVPRNGGGESQGQEN